MLVVAGNATRDVILSRDGRAERPGGTVLYAGLALARLGARVAAVGSAPPDARGILTRAGVDTSLLAVATRPCEFVNDLRHGERRQQAVAGPPVDKAAFAVAADGCAGVLVGPVLDEFPRDALRHVADGIPIVVDVQGFIRRPGAPDTSSTVELEEGDAGLARLPKGLERAFLHANAAEARALTGGLPPIDAARELRRCTGARGALVTRGAEGCVAAFENDVHVLPTGKLTPPDDTGAGDVFNAGTLWSLAQHTSPPVAAAFGNAAATLAVARPWRIENPLEKFPTMADVRLTLERRAGGRKT